MSRAKPVFSRQILITIVSRRNLWQSFLGGVDDLELRRKG